VVLSANERRVEPPTDLVTIAVIGARPAGREIACSAAVSGYKIILEDASQDVLDGALDWIKQAVDQGVAADSIATRASGATMKHLSTAGTVEEAIREADLIIDTTAEEIEMKIELFTLFDKFAKPNAIFATTAATLSISEMADITFCADRCIGMRFDGNGVLTLVRGSETSEETLAACAEVGRRLKKRIVVVDDAERSVSAAAHG
jgi:3-hydroxyacyl-CoA dehydrogenase